MSVVLCTEFNDTLVGYDDPDITVIFLYIALPFGWRAIPGYLPKIGEGITTAHRDYSSSHANRDGADRFDSQLFVDDAISTEPNLGAERK